MSNLLSRAVTSLTNKLDSLSSKVSNKVSGTRDSTQNPDDDGRSSPLIAKLSSLLAPFEEYFVSIQSILIWEKPYVSAVFIIAINCLYWLIVSWTRRFFSIVSLLFLFTSIYQCWTYYVWPEIRARPPEPDEGWVPVHPKVLSTPELSHYLHELMTLSGEIVNWFWLLRKNQPGLFCSLVTFLLSISAIIGSLVPGVVIVYIILMIVALGPGVVLYVVPESWYKIVRNFFGNSNSSSSNSLSYPSCPSSPTVLARNEDHLSVSSSEEKEQGRKLSEGYVKCDNLEESFELDKDESSLQLLSDSKLGSTLDFELGCNPNRESSSPSSSNNSSLQLVPSMHFGDGGETGDELDDYEIISDSDLPEEVATIPGRSKIPKRSRESSTPKNAQTTPIAATETETTTTTVSTPTSTAALSKDMLESDL